jgi:predicted DCC family thiol-disulfide oxidoreductase YuxK
MKTLYIIYDRECGFCESCRSWLCRQPAFLELRFIPRRSLAVTERFPGLAQLDTGEDLVVVSDEGAVYRGTSAYLMCLYALQEYREWAIRLSSPGFLPLTRRVFQQLTKQRGWISRRFFQLTSEQLEIELGRDLAPACTVKAPTQGGRYPQAVTPDAGPLRQ